MEQGALGKKRRAEGSSVLPIDQNGVAHLCHMDPDLMGSSCQRLTLKKRSFFPYSENFPMGDRRETFRTRTPDGLPLIRAFLSQKTLPNTFAGWRDSIDESEVGFFDLSLLE